MASEGASGRTGAVELSLIPYIRCTIALEMAVRGWVIVKQCNLALFKNIVHPRRSPESLREASGVTSSFDHVEWTAVSGVDNDRAESPIIG